jgi:hypothetical protein
MNSFIYRYLINKLDFPEKSDFNFFLTPKAINQSEDQLKNIGELLSKTTPTLDANQRIAFNTFDFNSGLKSHFRQLVLISKDTLIEILSEDRLCFGKNYPNILELLKIAAFSVNNRFLKDFLKPKTEYYALFCLLLEAYLYLGLFPDSWETQIKRAAHDYYVIIKKSITQLEYPETKNIYIYLLATWLFAQKTDNIISKKLPLPSCCVFYIENKKNIVEYITIQLSDIQKFYFLEKSFNRIPHPFINLFNDRVVGLFLQIHDESIVPYELVEFSKIKRKNKVGYEFLHRCKTQICNEILWKSVFFQFKCTMYRIDSLKLNCTINSLEIKAKMHFENRLFIERIDNNRYYGKGKKNWIVDFIKNPLRLTFEKQLEPDISVFSTNLTEMPNEESSIEMVTAWTFEKDKIEIDHTYLLGIYS